MQSLAWLPLFVCRYFSTSRQTLRAERRTAVRRPTVIQALERRELLTTFVVNSDVDAVDANPGDGSALTAGGVTSLRAAVQEANATSGADVIQLPAGLFQMLLTDVSDTGAASGDLDITENVTITGAGASSTILDFDDLNRFFDVPVGVTVTISQLRMTDASTGLFDAGGAIRNSGTLTLDHVDVRNNSTSSGGGAIANLDGGSLTLIDSIVLTNNSTGQEGGGGLFNAGTATVTRTTFDGNTSNSSGGNIMNNGSAATLTLIESTVKGGRVGTNRNGGGLYNGHTTTIRRSTFSDNQATNGGAIESNGFGSGQLSLVNCTVSGNLAISEGGGIHNVSTGDTCSIVDSTIVFNQSGFGGAGLRNEATATMTGSIIAKNTSNSSPSDINGSLLSTGYNLFGVSFPNADQTDLAGLDPLLDPLANNGGPTQTHRPRSGSPVIDAGNPFNNTSDDQRTFGRPKDGNGDGNARRDIGSVEVQSLSYTAPGPSDITVTLNGSNIDVIDNGTGNTVASSPVDPTGVVSISGSSGDDEVTIDFSNGNPIIGSGFTVNGGSNSGGGDTLNLTGMSFDSVTYALLAAPTGSITFTIGVSSSVLSFAQQEQLHDDLTVGQRTFNLRSTSETVTLADDAVAANGSSRLTAGANAETIDFTNPASGLTVAGGDGNDSITAASIDSLFTTSLELRGDNGADNINVSALSLPTKLRGGNDDDVLTGGSGADLITGEGGNDTHVGGAGNDTLLGGAGVDSLQGDDGNDVIRGQGSSRDTLTGGAGDDLLDGGGQDVLFESGDANFVLTDTLLTGLGNDTLIGLVEATLIGGASANTINASSYTGYALLYGGNGNDTLIGNNIANFLNGEGGDDSLVGNGGNDNLFGGAGRDTLDGGAGDDRLRGLGGSGDILIGGLGNDLLDGGAGTDRIVESSNSNFTITATQMTGMGTDSIVDIEEIQLTLGAGNNSVNGASAIASLTVFALGGNDTLIGGAGNDVFNGGDGDDVLKGRNGNDVLNGDAGNDTLNGGDGNDTLNGGAGADGLSGWNGNDSLVGGTENDTLYGGTGNDSLRGGDGSDVLQGGANDDDLKGDVGSDTLTGGTGNGSADAGDTFSDATTGEINNAFNLVPLPGWISDI